jgi:replication factor C subunit 3/5
LFSKGFKLIILDEADMMTQQAQAALRRVIEQYTKNVRFCIICNYVNKITPAIQSRCTRFRFSPLPVAQVEKRLATVVDAEKYAVPFSIWAYWTFFSSVNLTSDGRKALLKLSRGDMRRALNVLQACHAAYDIVGETEIYNCTGNPHPSDIEAIVNSMLSDEFTTSYQSQSLVIAGLQPFADGREVISKLKTERGLALQDLLTGAYEYLESIDLKPHARVYLLDHMATTEWADSFFFSESRWLTYLYLKTPTSFGRKWKDAVDRSARCFQEHYRAVHQIDIAQSYSALRGQRIYYSVQH